MACSVSGMSPIILTHGLYISGARAPQPTRGGCTFPARGRPKPRGGRRVRGLWASFPGHRVEPEQGCREDPRTEGEGRASTRGPHDGGCCFPAGALARPTRAWIRRGAVRPPSRVRCGCCSRWRAGAPNPQARVGRPRSTGRGRRPEARPVGCGRVPMGRSAERGGGPPSVHAGRTRPTGCDRCSEARHTSGGAFRDSGAWCWRRPVLGERLPADLARSGPVR